MLTIPLSTKGIRDLPPPIKSKPALQKADTE